MYDQTSVLLDTQSPPDADIEVTVEPCYEWSRIVRVGRRRALTGIADRGDDALDVQSLVRIIKQTEDDRFPQGWNLFGKLQIVSGTLLIADPMDFSDAVRIEGIPPALDYVWNALAIDAYGLVVGLDEAVANLPIQGPRP